MSELKQPQVKFKGKCMYAQVYPGQERAPHPDQIKEKPETADDRTYEISVECSEDLYKKLRKAGISAMQTLKEYDDQPGVTYIKVKGTHTKRWTDKESGESKLYRFSDPEVTDSDDNLLTTNNLIGNGSTVEVLADLVGFKGRPVKALRLKSVKVLEHVHYERPEVTGEVVLEESTLTDTKYKKKETKEDTSTDNFF